MEFIGKGGRSCVFCELPKERDDAGSLILDRGKRTFVIMNRFPYNNGHLMVAPFRHVVEPGDLTGEERTEVMDKLSLCIDVLKDSVNPAGFNLGANIGRASGAGFEHLHFHIVPRWEGDTNFMPILGEAKVIPEYLAATYDKLLSEFKAEARRRRPSVRRGVRKE